jgi:hypothetical protein
MRVFQTQPEYLADISLLILFLVQCGSDPTTLSYYPGDTYVHALSILTFLSKAFSLHLLVCQAGERSENYLMSEIFVSISEKDRQVFFLKMFGLRDFSIFL